MKKAFLLTGLALTFTLFISGCQRETEFKDPTGTPVDILLTLDDTRTVNDGMSTKWLENDELMGFYAPAGTESYSSGYCYSISDPETGKASGYAHLTEAAYDWYLVYPYDIWIKSPADRNQSELQIGNPVQQQFGNDNMSKLAGIAMPLYGVARNVPVNEVPTVTMHQAATVAAVNVTNGTSRGLNIWKITLKAPCDIAGRYSIDFSTGEPVYTTTPDKQEVYKEVTLDVYSPGQIPAGESARFYLVLKPFTLAAGDKLTLEIEGGTYDDRTTVTKELTVSEAVSFKPGYIKNLKVTFDGQTQESKVYDTLMKFYYAMDGPNWTDNSGWGTDDPIWTWTGVGFSAETGEVNLILRRMGLKGEIAECIGELTGLTLFWIDEPGVTGTLPASFANLVNLEVLSLEWTAMTSLPDIFGGMTKLRQVNLYVNEEMGGPLPESLGSSEHLESLSLISNGFTGNVPDSWARHRLYLRLASNHLTGKVPPSFLQGSHDDVAWGLTNILLQDPGYGFDISDIDIPGYWPRGNVTDCVTGNSFTFADVVKNNKYTVYLSWAPWCPFSKALLPQLLEYYNDYRSDGLEIIATQMIPEDMGMIQNGGYEEEEAKQLATILEKGYDQWYNFYYSTIEDMAFPASTPQAEVYDQNGNVVFSSFFKYPGPDARKRYGDYAASVDLIPFLESVLGPAQGPPPYASTDFSKDGEVLTLQQATVGNGINIVFMGDAYVDKDMAAGGLYETVMRRAMEEFFAIEPYKTFRNRFNVYAVKVVSLNDRIGNGCTTALGTSFGNGTEVFGDNDKCYEYALKVPGITKRDNLLVTVLVNTYRNVGTTTMTVSTQSSVAYSSTFGNELDDFGSIVRHESGGHGFAFLDDEYVVNQNAAPEWFINDRIEKYEKYGWFSNVDFTNDPEKVKWSAFLSDSRYQGKVGLFEGALFATGVWRPSENSMMRDDLEYFNAPSRWAIYQRIMKLSGEDYSFEKFLEYDAVNRNAVLSAPRPPLKAPRVREHPAPPVILP